MMHAWLREGLPCRACWGCPWGDRAGARRLMVTTLSVCLFWGSHLCFLHVLHTKTCDDP